MRYAFGAMTRARLGWIVLALFVTSWIALPASATEDVSMPTDETAWDIPGELLVDLADHVDDAQASSLFGSLAATFEPSGLAPETRIHVVRAAPSRVDELLAKLGREPRVEVVEPHARVRAMFAPDDPLLAEQWHLERIAAARAWDFSTGRGVTVAVVDTGIACEDHAPFAKATDLAKTRCVSGYNFVARNAHASDDQGHGTHVAGTIAQSTNNALGGAGVAFDARLMPVKVLNEDGWGTTSDVADGIRWAAQRGAQVINLSLGGPRNSRILQRAVDYAKSKGVVVVAAAGNSGGSVGYPGGSRGVIGVSATNAKDELAWFSSRGAGVDIAAPGVDVTQQTICNRGRDGCERFPRYSGTSMASPHVAGTAALLVSLGVTDPDAVERLLAKSARSAGRKAHFGAGILHAAKAVERAALEHALARILALAALIFFVFRSARRRGSAVSPWRASFLIPAFLAGPGLLFFAPFLLPRHHAPIDLLARPLGDWDLLISASWHGFLPFANVLLPFVLVSLLLSVRRLVPALAGLCLGTAAYLASVIVLGNVASPLGSVAFTAWCAANALACAWLGRLVLTAQR
jgi:serine protease